MFEEPSEMLPWQKKKKFGFCINLFYPSILIATMACLFVFSVTGQMTLLRIITDTE
jgi:hypothetical protein